MERGLLGHHTAATKERFVIVVDTAVPRLEALPASSGVAEADRWTWLPLTALQARIFGGGNFLGFPATLPDGVASRVRYVRLPAAEGLASLVGGC